MNPEERYYTKSKANDSWGNFLSNVAVNGQLGDTQGPWPMLNIQIEIIFFFQ